MGAFKIPWTNLAALAAGSGPAQVTVTPMTYNANYGSDLFNDSQWLVCRNFGFNIPSNAVIQHVAFAWEGGTISSFTGDVGVLNLALVIDNKMGLPPYTQNGGDLADSPYYDVQANIGVSDYWGFVDLTWPGSTANDGSSEFVGSDLWDYDYQGTLTDPQDTTTDFNGNPIISFAPKGLTVAQINSPNFGFAVAANYGDSTGSAALTVKSTRLMVWYTVSDSISITPTTMTAVNRVFTFIPNISTEFPDTRTITVTASGPWSMTSSAPWLKVTKVDGTHAQVIASSDPDPASGLPLVYSGNQYVQTGRFTGHVRFVSGTATAILDCTLNVSSPALSGAFVEKDFPF